MLESDQMVTSMWASMGSWFTPTYLFCFLNLMIATIYIASNFKNHHHQQNHHPPQPGQLARAPSLLNRVKSINFPFYTSDQQHYPFAQQSHTEQQQQQQHTMSTSQLGRAPSILERVKSINYSFFGQDNYNPFVPQQQFEEPRTEFSNHHFSSHEQQHNSRSTPTPSQLVRAPSILERVKSINYSFFGQESYNPFVPQPQFEEPTPEFQNYPSREQQHSSRPAPIQLVRAPSLLERVRSFNFSLYNHPDTYPNQTRSADQQPDWGSNNRVSPATRSKSSEKPAVTPAKVSAKMKKSSSAKGVRPAKSTADEEIERRRPATVRERKLKKEPEIVASGGEGCVDAKADDFINKFKHQLKLQRLDSMVRFKEMLGRGT